MNQSLNFLLGASQSKNHVSVWISQFTRANPRFQMWQVRCPKGSQWQLGLIYEYGLASRASNVIAAQHRAISFAFLQAHRTILG